MKRTREDFEQLLRGAQAVGWALDVLERSAAVVPEFAGRQARAVVDAMTDEQVRAALAALAVEAVWRLPLPPEAPRTAEDMWDRKQELQRWIWKRRGDVMRAKARAHEQLKAPRPSIPLPPRGSA